MVNPFNARQITTVSLLPQQVGAFVFWTRNARPFFPLLPRLQNEGYRFYFHWTLNRYPAEFEAKNPAAARVIDSMYELADIISPQRLIWRYDPVIVTSQTSLQWHAENFRFLAEKLRGASEKCIFSFVDMYKKVEGPLALLAQKGVSILTADFSKKTAFVRQIAGIAAQNKMQLQACCEDEYLSPGSVEKARCIDNSLLQQLYPEFQPAAQAKPTRNECGCVASVDIGAYDSCLFGCVYCYANRNFSRSRRRFQSHDPDNPRLIPAN